MEKSCRKMSIKKLVPDTFFILVNRPEQPSHARNCFNSKIFLKIIKNL